MEKKQLKLKAIENILVKCQQGKQGNSSEEAKHMLALLDDIKSINSGRPIYYSLNSGMRGSSVTTRASVRSGFSASK